MKTDAQIKKDVQAELRWEPAVHASAIGVEVRNGVVTLAGQVGSYPEKWEAEQAAQRVFDVRAVAVDLTVEISDADTREDSGIASAAANVLEWMSLLPRHAVKVLVEDGWIELTGELDWDFQRKAVEEGLGNLAGVKGINNYISLKTRVAASEVKVQIEDALKRRAAVDADRISVRVQGTEVTLSGLVDSWSERAAARNSAWGTAGVHSVVDQMSVAS